MLARKITYVSGKVYAPGKGLLIYEADGIPLLNTWREYEPKEKYSDSIDYSLWGEYLERLFPVEKERKTVCQWLAHMFQKPDEKPSWHLMLTSDTGTGKGFLFHKILYPLLSNQAELLNSYDKLTGQFSASCANNTLVFLDDCRSSSRHLQTMLKSILTESNQRVEEKYQQARMVETYTRFILASNELRPLRLDNNERRWYAVEYIKHRQSTEETGQFIDKLEDWLRLSGNLDGVYHWFMAYDLSGFNPYRCERTSTLNEMIEQSKSVLDVELCEWLIENKVFKLDTAKQTFDAPPDQIKRKLEELGYREARIHTNGQGVDRSRYWFPKECKPVDARKWLEDQAHDLVGTSPF
ncbi:primase-helicase family protein [Serratia fonticola]